jgi:general secretion pathway protein F
MVRAGESSGTLEIVLERLADMAEKQQALKRRIQSALAYPLLMSAIGTLVLFFLLTVIVPTITGIFEDMNQVLPGPTRFLISISAFFKDWWWALLIVLIAIALIGRSLKKTVKGRYLWDKTKLFLPGIGTITTKLAVARFARTLGSLLENGVTMLTALDIVKNISDNALIADVIEKAVTSVGQGQSVAVALNDGQIFPDLFIQMVQVGEQSGELEKMLYKIADVFENEAESTIMSVTSLLEPLMILLMGVVVGFIVLSICLPIFEMNQLVR